MYCITNKSMNWYIAKIVFQIVTASRPNAHQFDEHLRLIAASSKEEAVLKARIIGVQLEDNRARIDAQQPRWEFVNVADIQPLKNLNDGIELYSTIRQHEPSDEYIRYVHLRAAALQTESLHA
jgi:hypothetical protein